VKGIGLFVALLLVALGIATFVVTRPPSRELDREGRAWVTGFSTWRATFARRIVRAEEAIGVSREARLSSRLIDPLQGCADSLARIGEPPRLLKSVVEQASTACGEVEYALTVHARYGAPALATTWQHLHRAERWLTDAEVTLRRQLDTGAS